MMEKELGITATVVENIPDNADSVRIFKQLAQDHDIIFGTGFGYMDPMVEVAKAHPNVIFLNNTGYKTLDNLGTYMGREYEPTYLAGMVAGKMTKNNKLGFVGAFPIPELVSTINAFALGAQSVNPDITVNVIWSNTWYDPTIEKEAAKSLIDFGVDVIGMYQNSPAVVQEAAERGVYALGYHSDMSQYGPNVYLTNNQWNWGPYYTKTVKSVMDGTWKSEQYWGSMKEDAVKLAPYGKAVPQDVIDLVEAKKKEILDGNFKVFAGPIYDQEGKERVASGKVMTDQEILSMDWFVKGIIGKIASN